MVKAKKTAALTVEERLAQALVPAEDQPYSVPENWCWVKLGDILLEIKNGTTIKQDKGRQGFNVTRIESLQNQTIDFSRLGSIVKSSEIKENDWYSAGDIALSHINSADHVGKTAIVTEDMLPLVHGMNLLRLRFYPLCSPILFQYYSQSYQYKADIISRINMAVNQVSINQKQLASLEFPLPPLGEQQRIVDRIESLFAKLDEAKEKAQAALDSFETRRAAILHKAFTGELTAKWREENGVGMDSWVIATWSSVIKKIEAGKNLLCEGHPPSIGEFGIVKVSAVTWGEFNQNESKTCISKEHWNSNVKINSGDFLFSRANTLQLVGNCVIVQNIDKQLMLSDKILRFNFNDRVKPAFILYFTRTKQYRQQVEALASGNQDGMRNISQKNMGLVELPVPTSQEQTEIIRLLDAFFAKEQKAKKLCSVLDNIDLIKKSVLARAFRGELSTNDPTEENAIELLKRII